VSTQLLRKRKKG